MSFTEAIRDAFSKYVTFSGRSSRAAYWWFYLFVLLVAIAAYLLDLALGTKGILYGLAILVLLLPNLAVTVRRLHDSGHSGWWLLIALIPLIGAIVLLVFTLQDSDPPNQWGDGPDGRTVGGSAVV
ncbi:MAG: hypothetical protein QOF76_280 [Solirubrobacteraceae bacterium]|nr:hypothetical protein [Solirubrobacteraceae bacterium]